MTQETALSILKTGVNVFLTGEPGAGKTYTINKYIAYLRSRGIEPAITASTGIAATHIGGVTVHSWSGIGIAKSLSPDDVEQIAKKRLSLNNISRTSVLIIDEVSMLDGQTFSAVDEVCRRIKNPEKPFGGLQVVCVGDFFQLPPVSTDGDGPQFAFDSEAWREMAPVVCYLSEQHRQDDAVYLSVLSAIRGNSVDESHRHGLRARMTGRFSDGVTKLYTHNFAVDTMNDRELARLPGEERTYRMEGYGSRNLVAALQRGCLSPEILKLKIGAAVMFTKNNMAEGYVNGTLGAVEGFSELSGNPIVRTRKGRRIEVGRAEWRIEEAGAVLARVEQIPLRLAWAITVHKSQGMTLDAAIIDLGKAFEFGQGYVALSRVRNLEGVHLVGFNERALMVHPRVMQTDRSLRDASRKAEASFGALGEAELERVSEIFIQNCTPGGRRAAKGGKFKKEKTEEVTLALFREGLSVSDIAKRRGLTFGTVVGHLEKLAAKEAVSLADLLKAVPPHLAEALPEIQAAIEESDTGKITPIFNLFGGRYSFDEIRLARMLMLAK